MDKTTRAILSLGIIFIISHILALILAVPFKQEVGAQAFDEPESAKNSIYYIFILLLFSAIMLLVIKLKGDKAIRYIFLFCVWFLLFYVMSFLVFLVFPYMILVGGVWLDIPALFGFLLSFIMTYSLHKYPEWWVVNSVGIVMSAGAIAILGVSFGITPTFILLIGLAVYDAISVYWTKHMVTLAESAIDNKLPLLLVMPKDMKKYSFIKTTKAKKTFKKRKKDAMFMGLGDVIIPGILVVSTYVYLPVPAGGTFLTPLAVAMGVMIGSLAGFFAVITLASKGNPQAGLPMLNSGAIGGYIIMYLLMYQDWSLGLSLVW